MQQLVIDLNLNHQICTKYVNMHLGILLAGIENGVIDHDFQGHLVISTHDLKKWHLTSLLYTNLGRTRGVTRTKRALVYTYY